MIRIQHVSLISNHLFWSVSHTYFEHFFFWPVPYWEASFWTPFSPFCSTASHGCSCRKGSPLWFSPGLCASWTWVNCIHSFPDQPDPRRFAVQQLRSNSSTLGELKSHLRDFYNLIICSKQIAMNCGNLQVWCPSYSAYWWKASQHLAADLSWAERFVGVFHTNAARWNQPLTQPTLARDSLQEQQRTRSWVPWASPVHHSGVFLAALSVQSSYRQRLQKMSSWMIVKRVCMFLYAKTHQCCQSLSSIQSNKGTCEKTMQS